MIFSEVGFVFLLFHSLIVLWGIPVSSEKKTGTEEVLQTIEDLLNAEKA